ncbi:unnamed protein product [Cyprideis torosa]|uniref:Uncharacterized protein n=1 Tax=Cyprideis torosa TaxID=163714 RepID=A0A7R8ZZ22_9CRUS|nr:unnamed protein product [Cyprideis torosa]CAG0909158.1 unnamed protein product [Cyprideis torosa]
MDTAKNEEQSFFERLAAILNTPLPGTTGSGKAESAGKKTEAPEQEEEDSILDTIREILTQPLPGTQPEKNTQPDSNTTDNEMIAEPATEATLPVLEGDDWWERDFQAFQQHQERYRQSFHAKQQQDLERFTRYQAQEKQRIDAHQQREFDHFRQQQQWKLDTWKRQIEQGNSHLTAQQPQVMAPPPPPPIPGIPTPPWMTSPQRKKFANIHRVKKLPTIQRCEVVAKSRLFHIEAVDLTFSNGTQMQYERLRPNGGGGAVLVIPLLNPDTVIMIHEYAVGTERYELCLPKGRMEPGETPEEAANREMSEEIGYAAKRLTLLTSFTLAPAYMGHRTQIVLAEGLYPREAEGDEPEPLITEPWKLDNLHALAMSENCSEARTLAALYLVRDHLQTRN